MNLDALNVFLVVAKSRSIARAAEVLDMTTSTVSRKIKSLEDEFNTELFHRGGREFLLTSQGALIERRAEAIISEADSIRDLLSSDKQVNGPIRLMLPPSFADILAERFLGGFMARHPEIELSVKVSHGRRIETLYDYDIAISPNLPHDTSLVAKPMFRGRRHFFIGTSLLQQVGPIDDPSQLSQLPFLALFNDRSHHQGLYHWDNGSGDTGEFATRVKFSSDLPDVLARMVIQGVGVACLPNGAFRNLPASAYHRLFDETVYDQNVMYAIYPSRQYRPHRVKVFAKELSQFFEQSATL